MSVAEWVVVVVGLAAIAWVNWYFFLAGQAGSRRGPASGGANDRGGHDGNDRG